MTRTVVRPGDRHGATILVIRLSRPAVLRITIVRVYPTCSRIGAFTVRAHAGVNRIRFRGRLRGRPLPEGGYRLIVRARGAPRQAAAVRVVVANGPLTSAELRNARGTSVCSGPVAAADAGSQGVVPVAPSGGDDDSSGLEILASIKDRVKAPLGSAAGAIARTTRGFSERVKKAKDNPFDNPFVLMLLGAIALGSAVLGVVGGTALARIVRTTGLRGY